MALKFTIALPDSPAKDLGGREMHLTRGDNPEETTTLDGSAKSFDFTVERKTAVSLFMVDVDTSGNKSQPSPVLAFTAIDTIPPATPGTLNVTNVEEVD